MKFETITVMQRKNLGNYEHLEITTTVTLEEGEDFVASAMTARTYVEAVLNMPLDDIKKKEEPKEVVKEEEAVAEAPKKEKKTKAKKADTLESGQEVPPVIEEKKAPKAKNVVYNRTIEAHKNLLSAHLGNNFPGWKAAKPIDAIKAFTASLEGKEFLDEQGNVVDSFNDLLKEFFN